jgi:hypothetical protein
METDRKWLEPARVMPLTGDEPFKGMNARVRDFWTWASSDLRENVMRGVLAEFLVARALGAERELRVGWDNFDVLTPSGVRVEVKSSAYLQSWPQQRVSTIRFSGLSGRTWDPREGESEARQIRADVFVFAVQTCRDHALYDALDIGQWAFYVVDAAAVEARGTRSVGLGFLDSRALGPLHLNELASAVEVTGQPSA